MTSGEGAENSFGGEPLFIVDHDPKPREEREGAQQEYSDMPWFPSEFHAHKILGRRYCGNRYEVQIAYSLHEELGSGTSSIYKVWEPVTDIEPYLQSVENYLEEHDIPWSMTRNESEEQNDKGTFDVEGLLAYRMLILDPKLGEDSPMVEEFLIKWEGWPIYESSWEPKSSVDTTNWFEHEMAKRRREYKARQMAWLEGNDVNVLRKVKQSTNLSRMSGQGNVFMVAGADLAKGSKERKLMGNDAERQEVGMGARQKRYLRSEGVRAGKRLSTNRSTDRVDGMIAMEQDCSSPPLPRRSAVAYDALTRKTNYESVVQGQKPLVPHAEFHHQAPTDSHSREVFKYIRPIIAAQAGSLSDEHPHQWRELCRNFNFLASTKDQGIQTVPNPLTAADVRGLELSANVLMQKASVDILANGMMRLPTALEKTMSGSKDSSTAANVDVGRKGADVLNAVGSAVSESASSSADPVFQPIDIERLNKNTDAITKQQKAIEEHVSVYDVSIPVNGLRASLAVNSKDRWSEFAGREHSMELKKRRNQADGRFYNCLCKAFGGLDVWDIGYVKVKKLRQKYSSTINRCVAELTKEKPHLLAPTSNYRPAIIREADRVYFRCGICASLHDDLCIAHSCTKGVTPRGNSSSHCNDQVPGPPQPEHLKGIIEHFTCTSCKILLIDPCMKISSLVGLKVLGPFHGAAAVSAGSRRLDDVTFQMRFQYQRSMRYSILAGIFGDKGDQEGRAIFTRYPHTMRVRATKVTPAGPTPLWVDLVCIEAPERLKNRKDQPEELCANKLRECLPNTGIVVLEINCTIMRTEASVGARATNDVGTQFIALVGRKCGDESKITGDEFERTLRRTAVVEESKAEQIAYAIIEKANGLGEEMNSGDEIEVIGAQNHTIALRCPSTLSMMTVPARGVNCSHLDCFDLRFFLDDNVQKGWHKSRWKCPVGSCSKTVYPHELMIDDFVQRIITTFAQTYTGTEEDLACETIVLEPLADGTIKWNPLRGNGEIGHCAVENTKRKVPDIFNITEIVELD